MKRFIPFITSLTLIAGAFFPFAGRAASGVTMSFSPSNLTVKAGSEFTVTITLAATETADAFNAAEATLNFPASKLQVVSLSKTGSVFGLWPEEPSFNNSTGTIRFAGGRSSGFRGTGTALSVRFKTLAVGDARITLGAGSVLAHDGQGTNVLARFNGGLYAISNGVGYVSLESGDLIKLPDDKNAATNVDSAVYYFADDGLRYVFPNSKTYFTWYTDFSGVKEIGAEQLGTIGIGGNVTYRPGTRMIKVESDPKVYVVDRGGVRRAIASEGAAVALYGATWNKTIDDVPDGFFSNYIEGSTVSEGTSWTAQMATGGVTTISADMGLAAPVEVTINADGTFSPSSLSVARGRTIRFTNNTNATARAASNPHPTHTDLAGFDSANVPAGLNYVYRFTRAGTFGFHNHADPTKTGTVTVTQ